MQLLPSRNQQRTDGDNMSMCDGAYEIRHFEMLEEIADDGIPEDAITDKLAEWDEDTHLQDYPGETVIDIHYMKEHSELKRIGLSEEEIKNVL